MYKFISISLYILDYKNPENVGHQFFYFFEKKTEKSWK